MTAEMVRNAYQGIGTEYETLLRALDKENEAFSKRVGKDRSLNTYRKHLIVRKYVAEFIKKQYKRNDLGMNELTEDFIRDFCLYLRNEVGLAQSSVWIYSTPLKHIVTTAHYHGKIPRNPFAMYHVDPDHKEREYLTEKELLSMSSSYKVEAKGKDRNEIGFFAKFVLCSNNEHLPVIVDAGETRYWVRKIGRLECDDTDFLQKLKNEIPAFLYFLIHRELSTKKESRMWFAPKLIETEALRKIIRSNRNR